MRLNILADFDWRSGLGGVLDYISRLGYREFFEERDYGDGLYGVTVVLMCQPYELKLKRRIRMSKKERKIYMDIMLDLNEMIHASDVERRQIVLKRLVDEVLPIIKKYNINSFNYSDFSLDFLSFFVSSLNGIS